MFWASLLGTVVARLGLALYLEWAKSQLIRNEEQTRLALEQAERTIRALHYKDTHPIPPFDPQDPFRDFRGPPPPDPPATAREPDDRPDRL